MIEQTHLTEEESRLIMQVLAAVEKGLAVNMITQEEAEKIKTIAEDLKSISPGDKKEQLKKGLSNFNYKIGNEIALKQLIRRPITTDDFLEEFSNLEKAVKMLLGSKVFVPDKGFLKCKEEIEKAQERLTQSKHDENAVTIKISPAKDQRETIQRTNDISKTVGGSYCRMLEVIPPINPSEAKEEEKEEKGKEETPFSFEILRYKV